jgi:beta-lactamase class A
MVGRRNFIFGVGASVLLSGCTGARALDFDPIARLRDMERAAGGRLGAFVLDSASGRSFGWRADERFCHCLTFKLSLVAMVLREADAGRLDVAETLAFGRADIVDHSPVAEENLAKGRLPILALAEAVQIISDNAAAKVLTRRLGGPGAATRFW